MNRNDAALHTRHLKSSNFIILLSDLAGSVLGLIGIIGLFMNLIEDKYENFKKKRAKRLNLMQLSEHKSRLLQMNFMNKELVESISHIICTLDQSQSSNIDGNNVTNITKDSKAETQARDCCRIVLIC